MKQGGKDPCIWDMFQYTEGSIGKKKLLAYDYMANGSLDTHLFRGKQVLNWKTSLLDTRLNREASVEEVTKVCKVACWCIQDEEESRPSMSMVEQILEGVLDVNMPPIPQSVTSIDDNAERVLFFSYSPSSGSSQVHSKSSRLKSSYSWR
ncbi:hypothetical protein L1887_30270 [Cichorium endivia]|nr:hypothetical protein L1887_30270 [Cichorium endivia]